MSEPDGATYEALGNDVSRLQQENADLKKQLDELATRLMESGADNAWIPVSERLPEAEPWGEGCNYLVIDVLGVMWLASKWKGGWLSEEGGPDEVTHWLPLPEPPKDTPPRQQEKP